MILRGRLLLVPGLSQSGICAAWRRELAARLRYSRGGLPGSLQYGRSGENLAFAIEQAGLTGVDLQLAPRAPHRHEAGTAPAARTVITHHWGQPLGAIGNTRTGLTP